MINVGVPREPPAPWDGARQLPKLRSSALDSPRVFVAQGVIFDFNGKHRRLRQASDQPAPSAMHGMPCLGEVKPLARRSCAACVSSALQKQHQDWQGSAGQLLGAIPTLSCGHADVRLSKTGGCAPRSMRSLGLKLFAFTFVSCCRIRLPDRTCISLDASK